MADVASPLIAMLNGHGAPVNYDQQLDLFHRHDEARAAWIRDMLRDYSELQARYAQKCNDYDNEVESRRMWQGKASVHERALNEQRQLSGSNSFVLVVIDGDGAIFQDFLYAAGKDGGADAAAQLHSDVKTELKRTYQDANVDDWSIVVQVILNLQGLAAKLMACGILSSPNQLLEFGRAFGLVQPLFNFVDAGSGKEHADHKVRETLRLFLPNAQCKHVFFGPCSDNGYLPVLEKYKRDYASRLTLIETRPAEQGFVDLGLKIVRFPRVFRSDNLPGKPIPIAQPLSIPPGLSLPIRAPVGGQNAANGGPPTAPSSRSASVQMQAGCPPFIPPNPSPAPSSDSGNAPSTWATVGKAGATTKTIDIAPKKAPVRRHVLVNAYDQRVDSDLPRSEPGAEKRFAERLKNEGKFCNNYHLLGKCDMAEYCDYNHGNRLSPGERLVLQQKARSRSCPKRGNCRDLDCTFGHHCKYGKACMMENCWFMDTHSIDSQPAKRVFEDGSEEWIPQYLEKYRT